MGKGVCTQLLNTNAQKIAELQVELPRSCKEELQKPGSGRREPAWAGWGSPVLRSAWPWRLALLLEAAEDFGGSSVPPHCFIWVPSELTGVSNGDLKKLRCD